MFTSFQNLSQDKVPEFFVKLYYRGILCLKDKDSI